MSDFIPSLFLSLLSPLKTTSTPVVQMYRHQAGARVQDLYANIQNSAYRELPPLRRAPFLSAIRRLASTDFLRQSFLLKGDELPPDRQRWIHRFGSVARIRFVPRTNRYTGLFSAPTDGLIRLSVSLPLVGDGQISGIAIKFPVTDRPSENILLIPDFRMKSEPSFFNRPFNTKISSPHFRDGLGLQLLKERFEAALRQICPQQSAFRIPLDGMASTHVDGRNVATPVTPFALQLRPSDTMKDRWVGQEDFRRELAALGDNFPLYEVWARARDEAPWRHIGTLYVTAPFIASHYGDERLFFSHPFAGC